LIGLAQCSCGGLDLDRLGFSKLGLALQQGSP
jgi:hypothetical protein